MPSRKQNKQHHCGHAGCNWVGPYRKWAEHIKKPHELSDDEAQALSDDADREMGDDRYLY